MITYELILVAVLLSVPVLVHTVRKAHRQAERQRLRRLPFPAEWKAILEKRMPLYGFLPEKLRKQLKGYIQVFLAEKHFEGCEGIEVTDIMRVLIAAEACVLLLNRPPHYYPKLKTILIYPSAYRAGRKGLFDRDSADDKSVRLGESWRSGVVVLAWDNVKQTSSDYKCGHNVVFHEFAHQLDQESGAADGAPVLESRASYPAWARVLSKHYERLQKQSKKGKKTVMDRYGATNPAEFFAVATETFFEKPKQMNKKSPELYKQLKGYYRLDPLKWF